MKSILFTYIIIISNICGALAPAIGTGSLDIENLVGEVSLTQLVSGIIYLPNGSLQSDHSCNFSVSSSVTPLRGLTPASKWVYSDFSKRIIGLFDIWNFTKNFLDSISYAIHTITHGMKPPRKSPSSKPVKRGMGRDLNGISFYLEEDLGYLHDDLSHSTESVPKPYCSLTASNLPALYALVVNPTKQVTLPRSSSLSLFVQSVILLYFVNYAMAKYRSQFASLFCGRPPVRIQKPEPVEFDNAGPTEKQTNDSIDYSIPAFFFEDENSIADLDSPAHLTTPRKPILSEDRNDTKEISCPLTVPISEKVEHNMSLECRAQSEVNVDLSILPTYPLIAMRTNNFKPPDHEAIMQRLGAKLVPLPTQREPADASLASKQLFVCQSYYYIEKHVDFIISCMSELEKVQSELGKLLEIDRRRDGLETIRDPLILGNKFIISKFLSNYDELSIQANSIVQHRHRLQRFFSRTPSSSWNPLTEEAAKGMAKFFKKREAEAASLLEFVSGLLESSQRYLNGLEIDLLDESPSFIE